MASCFFVACSHLVDVRFRVAISLKNRCWSGCICVCVSSHKWYLCLFSSWEFCSFSFVMYRNSDLLQFLQCVNFYSFCAFHPKRVFIHFIDGNPVVSTLWSCVNSSLTEIWINLNHENYGFKKKATKKHILLTIIGEFLNFILCNCVPNKS